MDMNQAIRDFFGTSDPETGEDLRKWCRYNEALVTEILRLLVGDGTISKVAALSLIKQARTRAENKELIHYLGANMDEPLCDSKNVKNTTNIWGKVNCPKCRALIPSSKKKRQRTP